MTRQKPRCKWRPCTPAPDCTGDTPNPPHCVSLFGKIHLVPPPLGGTRWNRYLFPHLGTDEINAIIIVRWLCVAVAEASTKREKADLVHLVPTVAEQISVPAFCGDDSKNRTPVRPMRQSRDLGNKKAPPKWGRAQASHGSESSGGSYSTDPKSSSGGGAAAGAGAVAGL